MWDALLLAFHKQANSNGFRGWGKLSQNASCALQPRLIGSLCLHLCYLIHMIFGLGKSVVSELNVLGELSSG
jgi:hypothetical protein